MNEWRESASVGCEVVLHAELALGVHADESGVGENSADARGVVLLTHRNAGVATLTPVLAPRILDDGVVGATQLVMAVAHCEHSVVGLDLEALFRIDDARLVVLEDGIDGGEGEGDGADVERDLKIAGAFRLDLGEIGQLSALGLSLGL